MFYTPKRRDHSLLHDPLLALVVPRPIGWITSLSAAGIVNLAPYSFFNLVGVRPPYVMLASIGRKDTQRNIETTGEFVCNLATYRLRDAVNRSSAAVEATISEPERLGLPLCESQSVGVPRLADSPAALECRYWKTVDIPGADGAENAAVIFGEVVGVYIDDSIIVDGRVDYRRADPIARLGYLDYGTLGEIFSATRPSADDLAARAAE